MQINLQNLSGVFAGRKKFFLLAFVGVVGIGSVVLVNQMMRQSTQSKSQAQGKATVELKATYKNPFDKKTQYVNPFEKHKNPFVTNR